MTLEKEVIVDPEALALSLVGTPVLSAGRYDRLLGRANGFAARVKVYAEGGENATHTHLQEEHLFFVLAGQATFRLERDVSRTVIVEKHQGMLLPSGSYYRFESTGAENLVMLRVGYKTAPDDDRVRPDGKPLPGHSAENNHVDAVAVPGKFFVSS